MQQQAEGFAVSADLRVATVYVMPLMGGATVDEAIAALTALMQDQEAPAGLRNRAGQMITALGGKVPEAAPADAVPAASEG